MLCWKNGGRLWGVHPMTDENRTLPEHEAMRLVFATSWQCEDKQAGAKQQGESLHQMAGGMDEFHWVGVIFDGLLIPSASC